MKRFLLLSLGILSFSIWSCESDTKLNEQAFLDSLNTASEEKPIISDEVLESIFQQIPSPLEISVLLKESGINYNESFLNSTDNLAVYNSNFKKAMNLGVYGTDLGYTNIYEQNQDAIFYLNAIRDLSDGLSIGQFFNFGTIKRLATNSRNLDSLLLITTKNFNSINAYLQEQQRSNLSVLLLTGGWVEALHILCQVSEKNPNNQELIERIGEQKITLESIMLLLSFYSDSDPNIRELTEKMTALQTIFENIQITQTYAESTLEEVNGIVTITNKSTSSINITDEDVKKIAATTAQIRDYIVN
jgi:predicted regulator of amino acid metabolism with ACT domain